VPLAARGVEVYGIEFSSAMVEKLRAKPEAASIPVTVGDMATTRVEGSFTLVYLVYNTIMNLTTQEQQIACFENAAQHLEPGGRFVIEVGVPDLRRLPYGERYVVFDGTTSHWGVDEYDVERQGLVSHHFSRVDGRWQLDSGPFRYVWPAELDLMARIAAMTLVERWEDWSGAPFTSESRRHISVWQKRG
jgi:SAM-dependent methyltransferase